MGEHKDLYANNLKSNISNKEKHSFQPQKQVYRCKVTFTNKDNKAIEIYANSFTWLNSKETYLICSVSKNEFTPDKNFLKSVNFYFHKITRQKDENKEDIDFLNIKLFEKDISDVLLIDTEVEMLISIKYDMLV